jgi:hypothetical protein
MFAEMPLDNLNGTQIPGHRRQLGFSGRRHPSETT